MNFCTKGKFILKINKELFRLRKSEGKYGPFSSQKIDRKMLLTDY